MSCVNSDKEEEVENASRQKMITLPEDSTVIRFHDKLTKRLIEICFANEKFAKSLTRIRSGVGDHENFMKTRLAPSDDLRVDSSKETSNWGEIKVKRKGFQQGPINEAKKRCTIKPESWSHAERCWRCSYV